MLGLGLFVGPAVMRPEKLTGRLAAVLPSRRLNAPGASRTRAAPHSAAHSTARTANAPIAIEISRRAKRPHKRRIAPVPKALGAPLVTASIEKQHTAAQRKPWTRRFFHVLVKDGDTLQTRRHVIRLGDIRVRGAHAKCTNAAGKEWPCGNRARAALALLIRDRSVICTLPAGGERRKFTSRCHIGRIDLSVWMVRQGWARPGPNAGTALINAEKAAKTERKGIWGDAG